jgi:hypothetical protein
MGELKVVRPPVREEKTLLIFFLMEEKCFVSKLPKENGSFGLERSLACAGFQSRLQEFAECKVPKAKM